MDDGDGKMQTHHSFYVAKRTSSGIPIQNVWKSDMFIVTPNETEKLTGCKFSTTRDGCGEYYKRYEHDEIPVKDDGSVNKSKEIGTGDNKKICLTNSKLDQLENKILKNMPDYSVSRSSEVGTGDNRKNSLTNSELDQLETKVLENMSQELRTNGKSITSLESNIQFFKVTVQQIFDNFYTTMQDFDHYKKKFHDILEKNRAESLPEMEEFIKDMIHHIMSSESVSNLSAATTLNVKEQATSLSKNEIAQSTSDEGSAVLEAYKNDDFLTDSTDSSRIKRCMKKEDNNMFNIYLLGGTPCMEFKVNGRNLLSEMIIREPNNADVSKLASADDLRNADVRKKQMEKYENQQHESNCNPDREIPVKISSAKKNLYLDEDFVQERVGKSENRSFMSKLCNFLCKKLRKNSIG